MGGPFGFRLHKNWLLFLKGNGVDMLHPYSIIYQWSQPAKQKKFNPEDCAAKVG